jgi:hypothetical protein
MLTDRLVQPPEEDRLNIEFTDRYGAEGPPPWLFSCHGDCEAMGFYPEPDARHWPRPPGYLLTGDYEVGEEYELPQLRTTLVYVGPGWSFLNRDARHIWQADFDFDRFVTAVEERGYWTPSSAVEDAWPFIMCPECRGTGRVSRRVAVERVPKLLWRGLSGLRNPGGPEDLAVWRLRLWHTEYWIRQLLTLFTYKEPT